MRHLHSLDADDKNEQVSMLKKLEKLKFLLFWRVEIIFMSQIFIVLVAVSKWWIYLCNNMSKAAARAYSSVLVWKFEIVLPQLG